MCEKGKAGGAKQDRYVTVLSWDHTNFVGEIRITDGRGERTFYGLEFLYSDFGLAFRLHKEDGQKYDCVLNMPGGIDACDCKGGIRWGHCKHVDAIRILLEKGKIAYPAGRPMVADEPACDNF